jgi:hypothetical protein
MSITYIKNILTFLQTDPDLESFIKNYENNETGFLFSKDPRLELIMDAVEADGHTGASFACTLRACQSILLGIRTIEDYIQMQIEQEKILKEMEEQADQEQLKQADQEQLKQADQEQLKQQIEEKNEGYTYYS